MILVKLWCLIPFFRNINISLVAYEVKYTCMILAFLPHPICLFAYFWLL